MPIRFVVDGVSVEADSATEAMAMIKMLSKGGSASGRPTPAAPVVAAKSGSASPVVTLNDSGSDWNSAAVQRLSMTLSKAGRELLKLLLSQDRPTSTREIVSGLSMTDIRGTGALLAGFKKTVTQIGLSDPLVITPRAETEDKATLVGLTAAFRRAAAEAKIS